VLLSRKRAEVKAVRRREHGMRVEGYRAKEEVPTMPWESAMSNVVAHLASASLEIEALVGHCRYPGEATMSIELASQSIWTALVSLEASGLEFWSARESMPTVSSARRHERLIVGGGGPVGASSGAS
jgi:hypothetical protein